MRVEVFVPGQVHNVDLFLSPGCFLLLILHVTHAEHHVLPHRHPGQEAALLKHEDVVRARPLDLDTVRNHRTRGRRVETCHDAHHGCLAASRRPEYAYQFAVLELEIHAVEDEKSFAFVKRSIRIEDPRRSPTLDKILAQVTNYHVAHRYTEPHATDLILFSCEISLSRRTPISPMAIIAART